ncbi:NPCBM/NEW2 domain-containing protein, partial [Arsenicibacter rosenii]|uniref:NPCBM/NEW2 domain-containing protein n=1 Tax=Arsenicibacter rosenii TaxID=1750698 RepID=UPI001E657E6A
MMTKPLILLLLFVSVFSFAQPVRTVWLDDLPIQTFSEGLRPVQAKRNYSNDTLRINGKTYLRGLGGQSPCILPFALNGKANRFLALVAADDLGNKDIPLSFFVLGDGKVLFEKRDMRIGDQPVPVNVDLTGIRQLGLLVTDPVGGINNKRTYCNWIDARLEMAGDAMPGYVIHQETKYILTPPVAKTPKINSARLFGATPDNPVLYTIAATGQRPMTFAATGLPKGLTLDPKTGIISGRVAAKGAYPVKLSAGNALGTATQSLTIHIGDTIAMTPPIGWNGWNSWEAHIDQEKVIASADAMV